MASNNETVEQVCSVLFTYPKAEVCDGSGLTVLNNDKIADRILAAHNRECGKYKDHINELNRQILMLKHEREKRETYLCGYDPDEALVMQCSTCKFFVKKHSHCTFND